MSPRARHVLEMRTALERGCSLSAARAHLAQLRHRAAAEAVAKRRAPAALISIETARPKYWWQQEND